MKKCLFAYLLFAAGTALAEWTKMSENDDANVYIDRTTLRQDGNLRSVWQLHDEKKRGQDGTMSSRIRWEYDCMGERVRIISASNYSGSMGAGKKLYTVYEPSSWRDVAPGTMGHNGLKAVCVQ